jgi:TRAP transporter TAXI family solute receptor
MNRLIAAAIALVAMSTIAAPAPAQTRVTLKSATAGSSYYLMMVQLGEALKTASNGELSPTIEESQGSVQNVKEAARRPGNFVFTTPPGLVRDARDGKAPFAGESGYDALRGLFPIPGITMHWVVRADAGVQSLADLAGKDFIAGGRGTAGQRLTAAALTALGLEGKVRLVDTELASAPAAVRNRQVAGYGTASTHPSPQVQELAASTAIRLIGLNEDELAKVRAIDASSAPVVIARGTYSGVDQDVTTLSIPVGAYGTTRMSDDAAYAATRAFWTQREAMAKQNPWWGGVTPAMIAALGARLHPGALRYYAEAGVPVPDTLR